MKTTTTWLTGISIVFCGVLNTQAEKITFDDHIKPIFRQNCEQCHNPDKSKGGLNLSTYHALMAGGSSGASIEPGNADDSYLYLLVTHQEEPEMPPKKPKRPDAELEVIKNWIAGGALENASGKAMVAKKPKFEFKLSAASVGKPEGPPPMPKDLLLEPVILTPRANAVTAITGSPWAPVVAVGGQKQVILYHTDSLDPEGILPFPEGIPNVLKFSRNGKLLLAAGGIGAKQGRVVVWNIENGDRLIQVGDDYEEILAADISSDQAYIATGGPDKFVNIYDTQDNTRVHHIKKHTEWVTAMEFSPDGVLLATGDRNGGMHIWETQSGQEFYRLAGHKGMVTDISWRSDSDAVGSASEDGTIKLWNMHNGGPLKSWTAHGKGALSLDYTHDGRIVSCGRDNTAKTWDGNGKALKTFKKSPDLATAVTFSHDGKRVFMGDWTGHIHVWEAADGKRVGALSANPPSLAVRLAETEQTIKALNHPYQKLLADAKTKEEIVKKLTEELHGSKQGADQKNKALQATKTEWASAKKQLESASSAVDEIFKQVNARKQEVEAIKKSKDEKQSHALKIKAKLSATAAILANQEPNDAARQALQKAKDKIAELEKGAKKDEGKLTEAKKQLATAEKNAGDRQAAMDVAKEQISKAEQKSKEAETQHAQAQKTVEMKNTQLAAANKKLSESKAAAVKGKPDLATHHRRLAKWKAAQYNIQVIEARKKWSGRQSEYETLMASAKSAEAEANKEKAAYDKLKVEYEKMKPKSK